MSQISSHDILTTAKHCAAEGTEAGARSATSRAYYSMLHEAISSLEHLPNFSHEHHKNTVGYMTNSAECKNEPFPVRSLKALGFVLKQWRDARNEADYDLAGVTWTKDNAQDGIEAAEEFFQRWSELKTSKAS